MNHENLPLVLYGAGRNAVHRMEYVHKLGMRPVCFCDADTAKQGTEYLGLPVFSLEQAQKQYGEFDIYVTPAKGRSAILHYLISCGIKLERIINYKDHEINLPVRGPSVVIDLVNACNLHCPTCSRGIREIRNTSGKMNLNLFAKIIEKAATYNDKLVHLLNFSEPLLCDDLEKYLKIADQYGLETGISTNLSLTHIKNLQEILYTGRGYITVSVSGFSREIHEINHRGSDIEVIKNHLKFISACYAQRQFQRKIYIKFLLFSYNGHEVDLFRKWAATLPGLNFFQEPGYGDPVNEASIDYQNDDMFHDDSSVAARYLSSYEAEYASPFTRVCGVFNDLVLNHQGDVFLCCMYPQYPLFKLGNFLNDEINDLLMRKLLHPVCQMCQIGAKSYPIPAALKNNIIAVLGDG